MIDFGIFTEKRTRSGTLAAHLAYSSRRSDIAREPWSLVPDSAPLDDLITYYTAGATGLTSCLPPWASADGKLLDNLADSAMRARIRAEVARPTSNWEDLCAQATPAGVLISDLRTPQYRPYAGKRLSEIAAALQGKPRRLALIAPDVPWYQDCINDGGAKFNIGPTVDLANEVRLGLGNVAARKLGNESTGFLSALGSGSSANVMSP